MNNIISILTALSTFLLVLLTAAYVYLTRKLLQETTKTNRSSRDALEQQFRFQTFPQLFCQLIASENKLFVTVINSSNNIAYDVDVLVVTVWTEEHMTIPAFFSKYVKSEHHDVKLNASEEGFYGVFDRGWYPIFRTRAQVSFFVETPIVGLPVNILLQFRDTFGTNYVQYYWFIPSEDIFEHGYRLGATDPRTPTATVRLDWDAKRHLKPLGKDRMPEYLQEFADLFEASMSSGILKGATLEMEDRGTWKAL